MRDVRAGTVLVVALLAGCGRDDRAPAGAGMPGGNAPPPADGSPRETARPRAADGQPLRDPVALTVTAEVDGARSSYRGLGECHHTTEASIYQVPASQWSAGAGPASAH